MSETKIELKNTWIAGVLAFLIPGAGHLYQGRIFKGMLYLICIVGTFLYGMSLSEWTVVYYSQNPGKRNWGFIPQMPVGLPALFAYWQAGRYLRGDNTETRTLDAPLETDFEGELKYRMGDRKRISGTLKLKPVQSDFGVAVRGTFTGTIQGDADRAAEPVELTLAGRFFLGPKIFAGRGRLLGCGVVEDPEGRAQEIGEIKGVIPRAVLDWLEVPLDDEALGKLEKNINKSFPANSFRHPGAVGLEVLEGNLGKYYELAKIFTWIAGLLNILAIWDALEGPAYGYEEEEEEMPDPDQEKKSMTPES
jgi:TM2 domain-containing membrane protein YozV